MAFSPAALRARLIEPFLISHAPVRELAWGAAIGILTALLPLFGVQLYIALGLWAALRWSTGSTFNLPVCFAVSWVMNPLTVVPIYYVYYLTGDAIWDALTVPTPNWTFRQFEEVFIATIAPKGGEWWERFFGGMLVMFDYFGWPILLGSVIWAVPSSALAYAGTWWATTRHRRHVAAAAARDGGGQGGQGGETTLDSA
jgi:hypothetical protein